MEKPVGEMGREAAQDWEKIKLRLSANSLMNQILTLFVAFFIVKFHIA